MSVTLDDVRLARKRAYDRVDYWLQKYRGMTIHEAGISIPRIPKDLHPSEYGEWFDYFESFTGAQEEGGTQDYLEGENEPPELDLDYHPKPEPIDIEFPDEPEPPETAEDDFDSDDVSKVIDDTLNGEDDDWWDADDWYDDDTAPDLVDYEAAIIDNAYGINSDAGQAVEEALQNIKEQFENIGDMEKYKSGLESLFEDTYFWDNLQNTNKYRKQDGNIDNTGKSEEKILSEMNRALSKVYRHFGMSYYREY